jgi:hypothetical protein
MDIPDLASRIPHFLLLDIWWVLLAIKRGEIHIFRDSLLYMLT